MANCPGCGNIHGKGLYGEGCPNCGHPAPSIMGFDRAQVDRQAGRPTDAEMEDSPARKAAKASFQGSGS
jgi:predicted  nucleic acid-binding Zn-ribbon protein